MFSCIDSRPSQLPSMKYIRNETQHSRKVPSSNDNFSPQLFLDEDVRVQPYAKIELEGHKSELILTTNETSALVNFNT